MAFRTVSVFFLFWLCSLSFGVGVVPLEQRSPQIKEAFETHFGVPIADIRLSELKGLSAKYSFSYSRLSEIIAGDFSGVTWFANLDLSHNLIENIPAESFESIKTNHPDFNLYGDNPSGSGFIQLHHNQITTIEPYAFYNVDATINLSHNKLTHIPSNTFVKTPYFIALSNNQITQVDKAAVMGSRFLKINNNRLNDIAEGAFVNVGQVYLEHNGLRSVSHDWFVPGLGRTTHISVANNKIARLPNKACSPFNEDKPKERSCFVWFSGNRITRVHANFAHMLWNRDGGESFTTLDLSNNEISELEPDAITCEGGQGPYLFLNLSGNRLTNLPEEIVEAWKQCPIEVKLQDNSFSERTQARLKNELGDKVIFN